MTLINLWMAFFFITPIGTPTIIYSSLTPASYSLVQNPAPPSEPLVYTCARWSRIYHDAHHRLQWKKAKEVN